MSTPHLDLAADWLYVAFVIDVFARRIVGWQVSSSMRTGFVYVSIP
jgi:transposase InsO family protein